jgi:hypothetical protein
VRAAGDSCATIRPATSAPELANAVLSDPHFDEAMRAFKELMQLPPEQVAKMIKPPTEAMLAQLRELGWAASLTMIDESEASR